MNANALTLRSPWSTRIRGLRTPRRARVKRAFDSVLGHFWTVAPALKAAVRPPAAPVARPFEVTVADQIVGPVRITGLLSEVAGADTLVLVVHGLAGSAQSAYCVFAARAARAAGFSSLRLSLRGAEGSGEDIFHGGLTDDLKAALVSAELAAYRRILLLGYSVGGHVALRAAIQHIDPRVRAVAAICPPLDLDAATVAFDATSKRIYRRHIFGGLNRSYARTFANRAVSVPLSVVRRARSCRERDALTVVPRFGFASVEDYYARASVAADLHRLRIPSLLVASQHDPIIPADTLRPSIEHASPALQVRWIDRGGHVFFPPTLDLGQGGALGLESQVMGWLSRQ